MKTISLIEDCLHDSAIRLGGKGEGLKRLIQAGVCVPKTAIIPGEIYTGFIAAANLGELISLELNTKDFKDMRWEEIWDCAHRIRHLFITSEMPYEMEKSLLLFLETEFGQIPLAIRSSATDEDRSAVSFAGLHASYLEIRGTRKIIQHIKKVWASLWSDRALLYRQELELSVADSSMAVVIQECIQSECSGVGFTRDPLGESRMIVEAVHGLNQGLVDGEIEPDRYHLSLHGGKLLNHLPPTQRTHMLVAQRGGVVNQRLPTAKSAVPPLSNQQLAVLAERMNSLENLFDEPLDIEWTFAAETLYILQCRPVTALNGADHPDRRAWYLSLHRSLDNLLALRDKIENSVLPDMEQEAALMADIDLLALDDLQLASLIRSRLQRNSYWATVYWDDCIPFAHGVRLFGEIYNDLMLPEDPYEFVGLLRGENMLSTRRNSMLHQLAELVRSDPSIKEVMKTAGYGSVENPSFRAGCSELESTFGSVFAHNGGSAQSRQEMIARVVLEYAQLPDDAALLSPDDRLNLEKAFLKSVTESGYELDGGQLLDLARASYRIRDDDNIYIGKIEKHLSLAVGEGRQRLENRTHPVKQPLTPEEIAGLLSGEVVDVQPMRPAAPTGRGYDYQSVRARQLVGQPASKGVARGVARVVTQSDDMVEFQMGEVLVVESIDPNMTFLAPLAAAIVERRGGMLIHGAIIAREYGLPCVTGIAHLTEYITTGDLVTVDGYLGIVTIESTGSTSACSDG